MMVNWHGDVGRFLPGSTEPWAVSVLEAFVRLRRPLRLLELGTFEGHTTRALASVMREDAHLWTVDLSNRHGAFDDPRITFVQEDSVSFLKRSLGSWDFVFVDDDHTKEHVAEELDLLVKVTAPGGLIVGHDVLGEFDLAPLFLARGGFIIELPHLHAAGSLGVIEVPA